MLCHLVTGGAGFIGSCYVLQARKKGIRVVNLDKLTYAGNLDNLSSLSNDDNHIFIRGDISNSELVKYILDTYKPNAVVNFAAESHVDRSIADPDSFIKTNVLGTSILLRTVKDWYLSNKVDASFRFLHVSTDEVFGSLNIGDHPFQEETPYNPNSPYSASKAASDHLVRAFHRTFGLPILLTNCSNNYGPRQFPEKLIPLMILNALNNKALPIYGEGKNIRDWLYVEDHCDAISRVLEAGEVGESYNIGGQSEHSNLDIVQTICTILDDIRPSKDGSYAKLIRFVKDRPGHDFRYAMDITKINKKLNWAPSHSFKSGILETVKWYLDNNNWVNNVCSGLYRQWIDYNYKDRNVQ